MILKKITYSWICASLRYVDLKKKHKRHKKYTLLYSHNNEEDLGKEFGLNKNGNPTPKTSPNHFSIKLIKKWWIRS
jgi:hypothetical protein